MFCGFVLMTEVFSTSSVQFWTQAQSLNDRWSCQSSRKGHEFQDQSAGLELLWQSRLELKKKWGTDPDVHFKYIQAANSDRSSGYHSCLNLEQLVSEFMVVTRCNKQKTRALMMDQTTPNSTCRVTFPSSDQAASRVGNMQEARGTRRKELQ